MGWVQWVLLLEVESELSFEVNSIREKMVSRCRRFEKANVSRRGIGAEDFPWTWLT